MTREKTRSDAAEEGAIAKMMRAAFAHTSGFISAAACVSSQGVCSLNCFLDFQFEILDEILLLGNKECTIGSPQTDFVTRPHDALINQSLLAVVDADASR